MCLDDSLYHFFVAFWKHQTSPVAIVLGHWAELSDVQLNWSIM